MELILRAARFTKNQAVFCRGRSFSYSDLLTHSSKIKEKLLQGRSDLEGERVVFLAPQTYEFIPVQWGIWQAGGIAVPLSLQHPPPEWEYILTDSEASIVVCHSSLLSQLGPLAERRGIRLIPFGDFFSTEAVFPDPLPVNENRPAQIIYTSGTTGRPKGVITSHKAIHAQVQSLYSAWGWSEADHILEVLPLHHVHGNINIVSCALYSGARLTFHPKFEAQSVWKSFLNTKDLNIFMGVPTMYSKMIQLWKQMSSQDQTLATENCKKFRLMVSGSMALPEHMLNEWKTISNHMLLERYGMTECGMILSNPLIGNRRPGFVGTPLPGVEAKIVDSEIRVKSTGMFLEYYKKPEATKESFDEDGWFKTGDLATQNELGEFKILGRASVDIIKTGGFKLSALDVENDLLAHPDILEVSVVGVPDETYGQVVAAVFKAKQKLSLQGLQDWSKERMASYKTPRIILQVDEIPRNQMGKVNKKELVKLIIG